MWFERMPLEEWFDKYQYEVKYDIGESAVKFLTFDELQIDLSGLPLRYGYHKGRPDLREAIAGLYEGLSIDNIMVTSAGSESIFSIFAAMVKPGDHVIVEHPTYPSLYSVPRSLGCEVSFLSLRYETGFKPDLDELKSMIRPNTKLINFTHPNNPSGSMISGETLEKAVEIAESNDIYFLFDETYRDLAYTDPLPGAVELSEKAVSLSSMSKCYGLPGIRTGWMASRSKKLLDDVLAVREQVTITNGAINEEIALSVLKRKDEFIARSKDHVKKNFETVCSWMERQKQLEWFKPEAGVVSFPCINSDRIKDPEKVYTLLAEKYKTFVIPGRCFEMDNRFFRLGYGGTNEEIITGLNYLELTLKEISGAGGINA